MAASQPFAARAASNTFAARDPQRLRRLLEPHGASVTITDPSARRVRLSFPGELPASARHPRTGRTVALDLPALIARELESGEIAVLKEIRVVDGEIGATALAFNATGATVTVDLEEIYELSASAHPADDGIRPAAENDLRWLRNGFDLDEMAEKERQEIREAQTASPTPRHWRPVDIDDALLR